MKVEVAELIRHAGAGRGGNLAIVTGAYHETRHVQ